MVALLFAQGAVAAYACPALKTALAASAAQEAAMPADCEHMGRMDEATPNLCVAHCQLGQQSADSQPAPTVPPVLPNVLVVALADPAALESNGRLQASECFPAAASPPHAILHCCFRI
jgi:hypothetical protein